MNLMEFRVTEDILLSVSSTISVRHFVPGSTWMSLESRDGRDFRNSSSNVISRILCVGMPKPKNEPSRYRDFDDSEVTTSYSFSSTTPSSSTNIQIVASQLLTVLKGKVSGKKAEEANTLLEKQQKMRST